MYKKTTVILGVDIGGSHISAAAVNLSEMQIIPGTYFIKNLNNKESKEKVLKNWGALIRQSLEISSQVIGWDILETTGIGIAMPGPFDYPNGVAMFEGNDKYECLYKVDVRRSISSYINFPSEKIHFFNDASSFTMGAALQHDVVEKRTVGVTLGTGFGAAFLLNQIPSLEDVSIPENGCLWDKPFKGGIADDYFSTRWFVDKFTDETGQTCKGVKEILATNHRVIPQIFEEFNKNLSEFLVPHLKKFEAEVLLVGGNIVKASPHFIPGLRKELGSIQIDSVDNTEICNILGSSSLMNADYWSNKELKSFF